MCGLRTAVKGGGLAICEVVEVGWAAVGPMLDVVGLDPPGLGAPGEPAAAVAGLQRSALGSGRLAAGPAHTGRFPVLPFDGVASAVAGQLLPGLGRERDRVVQPGLVVVDVEVDFDPMAVDPRVGVGPWASTVWALATRASAVVGDVSAETSLSESTQADRPARNRMSSSGASRPRIT